MLTRRLRLAALATVLALAAGARAAVIDFEGIAPANGNTTDTGTRVLGDYYLQQLFGAHGHINDSGAANLIVGFVNNGTDWYWHHHFNPFQVGRNDHTGFDLVSFDAADYWVADGSQALTLTLTGSYVGGGTITQTITTDTLPGFETFTLGAGWTNLHHFTLDGANDLAAFDNFVVTPATPAGVPDAGATAALLLAALAGLAVHRRTSAG